MDLEKESKFKSVLRQVTLLLLSTLTVMVGTPLAPGINKISNQFASVVSNPDILAKLSISISAFTFAITALLIGVIIDRIGRKPVLITSLIVYIITGSMGFYLPNIYAILISRAILGIAAAGNMNCILTLIGDYYKGEKREKVLGFQVATGAIGSVILALIGGALFDVQWNYPFLIYFSPALLIPIAIYVIYEPKKEELKCDPSLQKHQASNQELDEEENTCTVEGLNRKWIIAICYFSVFALMFLFYLGTSQISHYIEDLGLGLSSFKVGIIMAVVMIAAAIIGVLYKFLKQALSFHIISIIGFGLLGIGFVILSFSKSFAIFFIAAAVGGTGFGFLLPNFSLYLISNTTAQNRGRVSSGYNTLWYIGESLSPIVFEPIILATSYSTAFLIGGIGFFALLLIPISLLIIQKIGTNTTAVQQTEQV